MHSLGCSLPQSEVRSAQVVCRVRNFDCARANRLLLSGRTLTLSETSGAVIRIEEGRKRAGPPLTSEGPPREDGEPQGKYAHVTCRTKLLFPCFEMIFKFNII
jgi:hypothetical protein